MGTFGDYKHPNMKGVTQEEVSRLSKAMKDSQFRSYMDEYCKETSDPKHRKEYIEYLEQIEAKGEMPEGQQLLRCQPGLCVKTSIAFKNGQTQKCFINIVHCDNLGDMVMEKSDKGDGHKVDLPYSLSPPRPDQDHNGEYCMTCDFAVSTRTFLQATQNAHILKMLVDTASDGLTTKFLKGHEDVKKDFKVMKRMACKGGAPMPMSVQSGLLKNRDSMNQRSKLADGRDAVTPAELHQMQKDIKDKRKSEEAKATVEVPAQRPAPTKAPEAPQRIRVPQHRLVHSGIIDLADYMQSNHQPATPLQNVPKLLKLTVEVPTVKKSSDINLEVTSCNVVVEVPEKYYLDLPLPYEVEEGDGVAKFDKTRHVLNLELPVKPKAPDPEMLAAAGFGRGLGGDVGESKDDDDHDDDDDGALSEGKGESEDELPEPKREPMVAPAETDARQPQMPTQSLAQEQMPKSEAGPAATENALPDTGPTPRRERLEVDRLGGALCIAAPDTSDGATAEATVVEGDEEPVPDFEPAEAFGGARGGRYFGLGERGLGYYRDSRQPRPFRRGSAPAAVDVAGAEPPAEQAIEYLVEDITPAKTAQASPQVSRPPLPELLRRYVDETSALLASVPAEELDVDSSHEADVELNWCQTRDNLILLARLPPGHSEASGVHLELVGRRLTLTFCSRSAAAAVGEDATQPRRWRRHCLRRPLYAAADPRQWHAEFSRNAAGNAELAIVLRKVCRGEAWSEAFDAAAPPPAPVEPTLGAPAAAGDRPSGSAAAGSLEGSACAKIGDAATDAFSGAETGSSLAAIHAAEDSAELDAALPVVHRPAGHDRGDPSGPVPARELDASAGDALKQSAAAMGQAVILQNRLMYQLV